MTSTLSIEGGGDLTAAQLEDAIAKQFEDAGIGLGADEIVSTTIVQMVAVRVNALDNVSVETMEEAIHGLYCEGAAQCSVERMEERQRTRRGLGAEQPSWSYDVTRVLSANNRSPLPSPSPLSSLPSETVPSPSPSSSLASTADALNRASPVPSLCPYPGSLLTPAVAVEALAEELGGVNASTVTLSSSSYIEARIAVSFLADAGVDLTALDEMRRLPEALSSLPIASGALSFTQEPQLLVPQSVPPAVPPAVPYVQTPPDADAPLDALSSRSSPATLSHLVVVILAIGGGVLLLTTLAIIWKKKRCRLRLSSTTTWMQEVSVEKTCSDISLDLHDGGNTSMKDTGLIPSMSTPGVLLPVAPRCSAQSPNQKGSTTATSPTAAAALQRARSASSRQSQGPSPRGTVIRSSSFGRLAVRGVPAKERVITADSARLTSALDALDDDMRM